jgi:hypothetical protein
MKPLTLVLELLLNPYSTKAKYYFAVKTLFASSFSGLPPVIAYVIIFFTIMRDVV